MFAAGTTSSSFTTTSPRRAEAAVRGYGGGDREWAPQAPGGWSGRPLTPRLRYSFTRGPNMPNIRHIRAYCRMGAYIREFC
eukprot:COSAG01_NODE_7091_length_3358_cov_5.097269_6_plen_80_part_01